MDKKYWLPAIIIIATGAATLYFFQSRPAPGPKFFPASEVNLNDAVITITNTKVEPAEITMRVGEKIVFINKSTDFAWPASNPHPTHTDYPELDPREPLDANEAWAFTFTKVGEWEYHDHLKPSRRGTIKVTP